MNLKKNHFSISLILKKFQFQLLNLMKNEDVTENAFGI